MARINIDIPDEVHARLKMIAAAEGKGFYEWLKEDLCQTCPDERTLLEMPRDIREDREKQGSWKVNLAFGFGRSFQRSSRGSW